MTDDELARLVAVDYQTYIEAYRDTPGVEVVVDDGIRTRSGDIDDDYLNGVFGTVVGPEDAERRIAETIDRLGGGGRPFHWSCWPTDEPGDLPHRLLAAGFQDVGSAPAMTLDLASLGAPEPPPAGLRIREALDHETRIAIAEFATMSVGWTADGRPNPFAATFVRLAEEPRPRLRIFGGWVDGALVSCAELFTGSGVAGIYAVATDEAMRGRGYGRALTLAAARAGHDEGLRTSVLMASDLGEPVYRRIGYRPVGTIRFLRWPGTMDAAHTSRVESRR